jgi:CBS domain containing-hemolysin-like protein
MSLKNPKNAMIWKRLKGNIQKPIAVILIINTIAHTFGASLSGAQFDELFGPKWIVIYSFAFSFVMIQWTEILPKTLGVKYNKFIANFISKPLLILIKVFTPVVKFIEYMNLPFIGKNNSHNKFDIINEISILSKIAFADSIFTKEQESIISKTINLSSVKAKDIMINFNSIKYLTPERSLEDALNEALIHNHTRFPLLSSTNINDVQGYINFKDIVSALNINQNTVDLRSIARPVLTIYEDEKLPSIFKKISLKNQHMAIVKDSNNNIKGLLTLEDIIEEVVGEIEDEYDILPTYINKISENRFIIGGGVKIDDLNRACIINLDDNNISISDWILKNKDIKIHPGYYIENESFSIIVKKLSRLRIGEILLERKSR